MYLLTETQFPSCVRLSEVVNGRIWHDTVNRFLENDDRWPKDLFDQVSPYISLVWWTMHIDDSVTDKIYSWLWKSDLAARYYSGKHHKIIQGIPIVTLFYTDNQGVKVPVNYRVVDKSEGKTKNDLFLEMLEETLTWWLKPSIVTWDSWYSSSGNCNFLIKREISFLFWLKANRLICQRWKNWEFQQVSQANLNENGEIVYLKWVSFVKVFQKDGSYYAYYDARAKDKKDDHFLNEFTQEHFLETKRRHWDIENYHRTIKQVCNIEKHRFRNRNTIKSHFFYALRAFCILEINRFRGTFQNLYQFSLKNTRNVIKNALWNFSLKNLILTWLNVNYNVNA